MPAEAATARLASIRPNPDTDRDLAFWHLAAGEAALARYRRTRAAPLALEAVDQLEAAARHASAEWLLEVRVRALRLRGRAYGLLGKGDAAALHWAHAHELEEVLVARQISDDVRLHLLHDVSDEHDERVRLAAEAVAGSDPDADPGAAAAAVAGIVVAMEAARGAAILGSVAPGLAPTLRALPGPGPGEQAAAWAWLRGVADGLAPEEAVWILHATPDRVHHGVVGRTMARHGVFAARRADLADDLEALRGCYDERLLVLPEVRAAFGGIVGRIGASAGLGRWPRSSRRRSRGWSWWPAGSCRTFPWRRCRFPPGGPRAGRSSRSGRASPCRICRASRYGPCWATGLGRTGARGRWSSTPCPSGRRPPRVAGLCWSARRRRRRT